MIRIVIPVLAIVLFLFLRAVQGLYLKVVASPRYRMMFARWFPILEFGVWMVFIYWSIGTLPAESGLSAFLTTALSVVLIAAIGWYFIRDAIAGFILRSENALEKGMTLNTGSYVGVVTELGYRSLKIKNAGGEIVRVPYSSLTAKQLLISVARDIPVRKSIDIEFSSLLQVDEIQQRLAKRMLEMPWVITSVPPVVNLDVKEQGIYSAHIELLVINQESLMKTHSSLLEFVKEEL
ncbi:MAG: mechanosensitive ion channel [Paludibacter sp.]|jgi:small-conductance mechanosensitive channel|nr:mechanosensitive ion channel [Paludibacter sp.]